MRLAGSIAAAQVALTAAWGSSKSNTDTDTSAFYQNESFDWLYGSKNIAMKVEGCVWATTDDNEDVGCMEDESGDGTTYWYQMAMCRRAQVAYSVYATDGSASCSSGNFKGTFVTQDGLSEFAYLMGTYDAYSPLNENSVGDLPMCEQGNNGYYLSVGCASDGSFTIDEFSDQFCLQRVSTYTYLSDINSIIKKKFHDCYGIYSANTDESVAYSTAGALVKSSKACSQLDSNLCQDTDRIQSASSGKMNAVSSAGHTIANFNVANKAKYALGTLCLIGSLFMFLGILFTNRRKRRAMMHRKMRASRSKRSSSKRRSSSRQGSSSRHKSSSSRSKSRSRRADDGRSRSKSKSHSSSRRNVDDGVFA